MPLVFVHGVNTRWDRDAVASAKRRNDLFYSCSLPCLRSDARSIDVKSPYWGDLGANPSAGGDYTTLPTASGYETFGGQPVLAGLLTRDLIQAIVTSPEQPLLATARQISLPCAVDLLWASAVEAVSDEESRKELGRFIAAAIDYAERVPAPRWLLEVQTDYSLITRLKSEVEAGQESTVERFGLGDWWGYVQSGATAVRDFAQRNLIEWPRYAVSRVGLYFLRPWMNDFGARSIGDSLVYVHSRGTAAAPGPIIQRVLQDLRAAAAARTDADPLIVIGHSLGGVISFDIFSHFATDLKCDLLVTVGSQVGFLQELGLLANPRPTAPSARTDKPKFVRRWINVFDPLDVLAFAAEPVFTGVKDLSFSNETGALSAHTSYMYSPRFHRRLGRRMKEALS
jgi:hypothetical protein